MSEDKEDTIKELKSTFEDFKEINERREKEIEEHGEALAETEQTLEELNEKMDELETKMDRPNLEGPEDKGGEESEYKDIFFDVLKKGEDKLDPNKQKELKELTVADDTTGGYLAPSEYVVDIIEGVTEFSPVRDVANVRQTSNKSLEYPVKDGSFSAQWVGETESRSETTGLKWGLEEIPTHELEALVKVSKQNLEDSAFDLEAMLQDEFTEQFGVAEGEAFIDGDAVGKPEGILTNSDVSSIDSTNDDDLDDADDLIRLFYEVKSPYANNGTWLLKRSTIKDIRVLKDSNDQYLWQPGIAGEQPATILDRPYLECPDMPSVSGDSYPVAFGDFGRGYLIVDRTQMNVLRDPYSSKPLVEFEAYRRVGGQVVLPEAIKLLHVTSS